MKRIRPGRRLAGRGGLEITEKGGLTGQAPLLGFIADAQAGYFSATFLNENGMSTVALRWPENTSLLGVMSLAMAQVKLYSLMTMPLPLGFQRPPTFTLVCLMGVPLSSTSVRPCIAISATLSFFASFGSSVSFSSTGTACC